MCFLPSIPFAHRTATHCPCLRYKAHLTAFAWTTQTPGHRSRQARTEQTGLSSPQHDGKKHKQEMSARNPRIAGNPGTSPSSDTAAYISANPTPHERQVGNTASLAWRRLRSEPRLAPYRLETDSTFADG
ncbi:hypothetical protein SBA5_880032 [Candidatus Sulfotelmatomonas gaucii]|uniref:Uncharacterized protein n=1 Tax=Candidatus Sulfuritelmatomonas gaucii TaxID=2043161 RepID=A0A2N9M7D7_9BACT|nr:hypothetical protein SBA5_880032 [Candidatus Sulfotelmatomonas gaucii]